MKILVTICARGGSKGIPGKNIKILNGTPLVAYSIKAAEDFFNYFKDEDIYLALSTDSQEIINICSDYGLSSEYVRKHELSGDSVGNKDVIKDLFYWHEKRKKCIYDYILDLDVTSPLRNLTDLINAFKLITNSKEAINLFSVSPASRNPYFNMVEQKENGFYAQVKKIDENYSTRQSAPKVFDMNASFYFYKRAFFEKRYNSAITDKSLIYEVPHICFDLDHPFDFEYLSFLVENNKLDFKWL